jgi:hypothetical protein
MTELSFNINNFGDNEQYTGAKAMAMIIYNLMVMQKNTDPLNPDKGIDLLSMLPTIQDDGKISDIESEINKQIQMYTDFTSLDIQLRVNNNILMIAMMSPDYNDFIVSMTVDTAVKETELSVQINKFK